MILALLAPLLGASSASPANRLPRPAVPVDSVRLLRWAQSAQRTFEAFRRRHLPIGDRGESICDIRIGRFCYWRGDDSEEQPPPESRAITEQRLELLHLLDSATRVLPGDEWLAGQYVRYLADADSTDAALRAAAACRAGTAWCAALAGYAAQTGGRFATADSAFGIALDAMTDAERCRWLDIGDLTEDRLRDSLAHLPCPDRLSLIRRVLWLGAPLFSVSTSDLLTEYLARMVGVRIAEHAATIDGTTWGDDERDLVLRYGAPRWYTRTVPDFASELDPSYVGHDAGLPYDFLPTLHGATHLGHLGPDDWALDDPRANMGYAPSYARSMHDLPSQLATFRRGESTLVVAAWDARRDTTLLGRDVDAALVLAADGGVRGIARTQTTVAAGHLAVIGRLDSGVISLELLARADRRAARRRVGLPARTPGRIALSDLLLFAPDSTQVASVDAALDRALFEPGVSLASPSLASRPRVVGVYWETYGLRAGGEPVHVSLDVHQINVSWSRRFAERLHLADPTTGLRIRWDEVPSSSHGIAARTVQLDLSRLRGGRYLVELTESARGEPPVTMTRDIELP